MIHKLLLATALGAVALVGVAAAQTGGGAHGFADMFMAADTDHDGKVSRTEFDTARAARFAQMDANHDGQLSGDEIPHWGPPPGANGGGSGGGEHHGGGMMRADTNGDGVISRAEYDASSAALFTRLDANNDGFITQDELQAMRPPQ